MARRYRLDDADVDEVMEEVRIRLWRARETRESIGEVRTSYVYRTASSATLDVIRRRRSRRAEHHQSIDEQAGGKIAAAMPGPHGDLEATELGAQVAGAIATIPESRRPAVRMYLAGYPREEIAELMGWTDGKTRNLLYRGLADLRARLTEMGIGWQQAEEAS